MTETREHMEARHAAERAALEAREVDPLLMEAREVCAKWMETMHSPEGASRYRSGEWDRSTLMEIALAALHRGMELAAPIPAPAMGEGVDSGMSGEAVDRAELLWANLPTGRKWTSLQTHEKALVCHTLARVPVAAWPGGFLSELRTVNGERAEAWLMGQKSDPLFWAVELGGEVGEILNVVKKLVREELGWRGSRATVQDLADEIADGIICLDSLARHYGIDLASAVTAKFNATSEKNNFPHRLRAHMTAKPAEGRVNMFYEDSRILGGAA